MALKHGSRKFYEIPSDECSQKSATDKLNTAKPVDVLLKYIDESCIGKKTTFSGPFGTRKVVYCDYTASGRSLSFIEDYIRDQVLPHYGNTHTTSTVTSLQTTMYRHETRDIIRNAVNAGEGDAVIFTGSGCTAAVHKLIHALDLKEPPIVFVGPYEHHSNLLPWRELGSQMAWIEQDKNGLVDVQDLEKKLKEHAVSGKQMIGCFAAASNVTGILADTDSITASLHRHGALAFWDYATAGPYLEIDMNPLVPNEDQVLVYKDAVFMSPHKFVGGVGTPGILVAKKKLFKNPVPSGCGGGSVFFVTNDTHRYLKETEMREEGGTPSIVESIRAGLVFQLKQVIGTDVILLKEQELHRKALLAWSNQDTLVLLGNMLVPRLPIFSFLIRHPGSGLFLHHNYVCALLNDLFGIQARGGCVCAGPYAQDLLGIDDSLAHHIEALLLEDSRLDRSHLRRYHEYSEREVLRPGFVRLNLPYFMSDEELSFVLKAVQVVAEHGWKLLPQYMFNPETGEWRHKRHQVFRDRKWLGSISYASGHMTYPSASTLPDKIPNTLQDCLSRAEEIFSQASKTKILTRTPLEPTSSHPAVFHQHPSDQFNTNKSFQPPSSAADQSLLLGDPGEAMRWFVLPNEAADLLYEKKPAHFPRRPPFTPRVWNPCERSSDVDKEKDPVRGRESDELSCTGSCEERAATVQETTTIQETTMPRKSLNQEGCSLKAIENNTIGDKVDGDITKAESSKLNCGMCQRETSSSVHSENGVIGNEVSTKECAVPTLCENCGDFNPDNPTTDKCSKEARHEPGKGYVDHCATCISSEIRETTKEIERENVIFKEDGYTRNCAPCFKTKDATQELVCPVDCDGAQLLPSEQEEVGGDAAKKDAAPASRNKVQEKAGKPRFHSPPKSIFKPTVQAIEEYNMIRDGDRVLVCLSGGKDSLSLLHTLRQYQFLARSKGISFEFGAATVDPQSAAYDPRPLVRYLASLEVPYFLEEQGIIQQAVQLPECESICSFCSRMKRGRLYACARREGYNVLAMGQHLDDLAESFLMSAFHNGLLRTMKANYTVKEGDLRLIRPLLYVREKELRTFAEKCRLPVIAENCPACFEAPKERHRTKQLLAAQEILFPGLFNSLLTAMRPLMARDRVGLESSKMKAGNYDDFL